MIEEFRVISPDFEISEFGRIRTISTGNLRCINGLSKHGDLIFSDWSKSFQVKIGESVAKMWIPNPEGKKYVGYLDGDRFNCHYSNLYWCDLEDMYKFYPRVWERSNNLKSWELARQMNELPEDLMDFDKYELSWEDYFNSLPTGARICVYYPEDKTGHSREIKIGNPARGYSFFNEMVGHRIAFIESGSPFNIAYAQHNPHYYSLRN